MSVRILMTSILASTLGSIAGAGELLVYFGTFTGDVSKGIYVSRFDPDTGGISEPRLAWEVASPNYLAVSPDGRFLFAATRPNAKEGFVDSFQIDRASGMLKQVDVASSGGAGPCHLTLDGSGRTLLVANYSSGSVKSLRVSPEGKLTGASVIQHEGSSINAARQSGPHAHCIMPAPGDRFALVCDLGMDRLMVYRLDAGSSALTENNPASAAAAPGSGPRHLVFAPDARHVHVVNEMAVTLATYSWNAASGTLELQGTTSLLPAGIDVASNYSAAAIVFRPDGRFLYATVRGHNSVSVFSVGSDGTPALVENVPSGGKTPRGLGIDPSGKWLLVGNQDSDLVNEFSIDRETGRLSPTERRLTVGSPVDVRFVRAEGEATAR